MQGKYLGVAVSLMVLLTPTSLLAAPVLRSGEAIVVTETQEVPSDFYAAGGSVTVSGKINGDLFVAGGTVTTNGAVVQDAVIVGGTVHIGGPVGDDIRIVGGDVVVAGTVGGDILVLGGSVHILSTARIAGDVLVVGGEVSVDGEVRGALSGRAGALRVNGPVRGDVSVVVGRTLTLGDQAHIEGDVRYTGIADLSRAPGSVVNGDVIKNEVSHTGNAPSFNILPLLALLFIALASVLLFKARLERLMSHAVVSYGRHVLVGFGMLVLAPIAAAVLMVSVVGFLAGLTLLFAYLLLGVMAMSLGGVLVGALLSRHFDGVASVSIKWTLLGTLALWVVSFIPFIGFLVSGAVGLIVLGTLSTLLYERMRV